MAPQSSLPPLELSKYLSLVDPPLLSLSAFGVIILVTTVRIAQTISAPIVILPPLVTPKALVSLSTATFVIDGDIPTDTVLPGSAEFVIDMGILRTTVLLKRCLLRRPPISLVLCPPPTEERPGGILIEPGVQCYEGGNVTVCLVCHRVLLFSFSFSSHQFLGMFQERFIHC